MGFVKHLLVGFVNQLLVSIAALTHYNLHGVKSKEMSTIHARISANTLPVQVVVILCHETIQRCCKVLNGI